MSGFFDPDILKQIKGMKQALMYKNFISQNECSELLDYFRNLKNKSVGKSQSVEREESTKIFLILNNQINY